MLHWYHVYLKNGYNRQTSLKSQLVTVDLLAADTRSQGASRIEIHRTSLLLLEISTLSRWSTLGSKLTGYPSIASVSNLAHVPMFQVEMRMILIPTFHPPWRSKGQPCNDPHSPYVQALLRTSFFNRWCCRGGNLRSVMSVSRYELKREDH